MSLWRTCEGYGSPHLVGGAALGTHQPGVQPGVCPTSGLTQLAVVPRCNALPEVQGGRRRPPRVQVRGARRFVEAPSSVGRPVRCLAAGHPRDVARRFRAGWAALDEPERRYRSHALVRRPRRAPVAGVLSAQRGGAGVCRRAQAGVPGRAARAVFRRGREHRPLGDVGARLRSRWRAPSPPLTGLRGHATGAIRCGASVASALAVRARSLSRRAGGKLGWCTMCPCPRAPTVSPPNERARLTSLIIFFCAVL